MTPAERIAAIQESAALLSQQIIWGDIDLILEQHYMPTSSPKPGDDREDRYNYVVNSIKNAPNNELHALHHYLIGESGDVPTGAQPWGQAQLKLFMSHNADHQGFIGAIGEYLHWYGVSCFVAHVDIVPSEEWQIAIEVALQSCDAMAVFLHNGFHESFWCDQEVGFAIARRVPVLPIIIDRTPYGFMGKLQAVRCLPNEDHWTVGNRVLDWLIRTPSVQTAMTEGLVTAFERSGSYNNTRRIYGMLAGMPAFTALQLERLETATKDNGEVRDAFYNSNTVPNLIHKLIIEHGGSPAGTESEYSDEPPF